MIQSSRYAAPGSTSVITRLILADADQQLPVRAQRQPTDSARLPYHCSQQELPCDVSDVMRAARERRATAPSTPTSILRRTWSQRRSPSSYASSARASARSRRAGVDQIVRAYLSVEHRDNPEDGCPSAALLDEIGRSTDATKRAYTDGLLVVIDDIAAHLASDDPHSAHVKRSASSPC